MEDIVFYFHYAALLLFGILLSAAFSGIGIFNKKNLLQVLACFAVCGGLQLWGLFTFDEETVWKIYPLITHLPIVFWICVFYKKKVPTAFAAVFSAYLCCQPANWLGIFSESIYKNGIFSAAVRILALFATAFLAIKFIAGSLSEIFQKDLKSIVIFGMVPMLYYLFDYIIGVYSFFEVENANFYVEFLAFFLCVVFLVFCAVYYREYESKTTAMQNEQIVRLIAKQHEKEVENSKIAEQEIRYLRHDMRHLLTAVASSLEKDEPENAKELISAYIQKIDRTRQNRFCGNETLNCVLSDFSAKCELFSVDFDYSIALDEIETDEIVFASILSNALDNALNEQKKLLSDERNISLMLKKTDGKLLLSVKNPVKNPPVFSEGIPVTDKAGHGFGCRSISYMAKKLGGKSRFSMENGFFVVRVIV